MCTPLDLAVYPNYDKDPERPPLDLAVAKKKEEAAAVLRAHGALHSLHVAAERDMTNEVAAGIAAGQDVNARDQVIFLCVCVWMGGWVGVAASLVYTSCIYISLYLYIYYIYISHTHTHTHTHTQTHVSFFFFPYLG